MRIYRLQLVGRPFIKKCGKKTETKNEKLSLFLNLKRKFLLMDCDGILLFEEVGDFSLDILFVHNFWRSFGIFQFLHSFKWLIIIIRATCPPP